MTPSQMELARSYLSVALSALMDGSDVLLKSGEDNAVKKADELTAAIRIIRRARGELEKELGL